MHPENLPANDNKSRKPQRRLLSYAILTGAVLTLFGVLCTERSSVGGPPPRAPIATQPAPRAAEPPEPIAPQVPAVAAARPQVELVFALDTTSSMTGLIEGAKKKIWSLASFVAQGQPTPDLRVGLIGFRDIGDDYVTKVYDLDSDLDRVYRRLRSFRAEGGGDTPEHVARALDESVRKMSWTPSPAVVKVIYLVGDAPPHTDYDDGFSVAKAARAAHGKGIQVHTIQCGNDGDTETTWRRVASLGGGQFMAIQQDGGMHEERTRYDDELAKLHDELGRTAIAYGAGAPGTAAAIAEAAAAPVSVKAARAGFMARHKKAVASKGDLVEGVRNGSVSLGALSAKELPDEMRRMDKDAQAAYLRDKQAKREEISRRIDELGKLRQVELDEREKAAAKEGRADGFDVAARKALKKSVADNALSGLKL
jgi:hypothetical protein